MSLECCLWYEAEGGPYTMGLRWVIRSPFGGWRSLVIAVTAGQSQIYLTIDSVYTVDHRRHLLSRELIVLEYIHEVPDILSQVSWPAPLMMIMLIDWYLYLFDGVPHTPGHHFLVLRGTWQHCNPSIKFNRPNSNNILMTAQTAKIDVEKISIWHGSIGFQSLINIGPRVAAMLNIVH